MFNEYVWKTYLKAGGEKMSSFFERGLHENFGEEYVRGICRLHSEYSADNSLTKELTFDLENLVYDINDPVENAPADDQESPMADGDITHIMESFYMGISECAKSEQQIFDIFSAGISYYTTCLSMDFPEQFVPYYFQCCFNVFERIAQEFQIVLPPIPLKKNYKGRFFYYGEICMALQKFRQEHGMSPYELCAFLYDFAPKYIGGTDSYIVKDLPEPRAVFFIGGAKDDEKLSEDSATVSRWQCSPDTKVGDLVVMYLRSPISAVDSVWRSISTGFNDPFFYYYRCTYIAKPQKLNRITQKQLQQDAIFQNLPIVKKNMQGINGVELYPSVYNHLLDMAESDLPRLKYMASGNVGGLDTERDVENKLIKPFLKKLGYTENEYQQQLYIEIGNHNHALIPDFVIHPIVSSGHQSADFLIEAKHAISSVKALEEAKTQARGYAKLLNAKYSVVASKEGIWITKASDDFSKDILALSWAELKQEDRFFEVFKMIGNDKGHL